MAKATKPTEEHEIQAAPRRDDVTPGTALRAARPPAPPERALSLAGSTIKERYRVQALASVSREAAIYTAEDVRYGRSITLKVLREEVAADAEFVAAVREQASTLALFAHLHRGIARVYECNVTEAGDVFVAVERTHGVTLRETLEARGALDLAIALRIATRVGEALEALHHNRIIHGPLSPDAVVMVPTAGGTEQITLVGVELAAAYRTPLGLRLRESSPLAYRSPEPIDDIDALGMLLRDMLTAQGVRSAIAPDPAPPAPPADIERIISTALETRPELRYPDISVMLNDMWGAHTMLAVPESRPRLTRPQAHGRRRRPRRSRSTLRIATALVMASLLAAVVWVATDRITSRSRAAATAPAVAPAAVETGDAAAAAPAARPVASEPPPSTPPAASRAGEQKSTPPPDVPSVAEKAPSQAEKAPAALAKPRPAPAPERKESAPAAVVGDRPPRPVESRPAAPRQAGAAQPAAEAEDGSGAIDWLLNNRR